MSDAAWQNARDAIPDGPFIAALSVAVGDGRGYVLNQAVSFSRQNNPIGPDTLTWPLVEGLNAAWPCVRMSEPAIDPRLEGRLAKFFADRFPEVWRRA